MKDPDEAYYSLIKLVNAKLSCSKYHLQMGKMQFKLGKNGPAIKSYKKYFENLKNEKTCSENETKKMKKDKVEAWMDIGELYYKSGEAENSIKCYKKAEKMKALLGYITLIK